MVMASTPAVTHAAIRSVRLDERARYAEARVAAGPGDQLRRFGQGRGRIEVARPRWPEVAYLLTVMRARPRSRAMVRWLAPLRRVMDQITKQVHV
ncbi:MAG: hypothetical protein U0821_26935 [Chloroflexota bacterium]